MRAVAMEQHNLRQQVRPGLAWPAWPLRQALALGSGENVQKVHKTFIVFPADHISAYHGHIIFYLSKRAAYAMVCARISASDHPKI